mgnify:CR=1 FL=1
MSPCGPGRASAPTARSPRQKQQPAGVPPLDASPASWRTDRHDVETLDEPLRAPAVDHAEQHRHPLLAAAPRPPPHRPSLPRPTAAGRDPRPRAGGLSPAVRLAPRRSRRRGHRAPGPLRRARHRHRARRRGSALRGRRACRRGTTCRPRSRRASSGADQGPKRRRRDMDGAGRRAALALALPAAVPRRPFLSCLRHRRLRPLLADRGKHPQHELSRDRPVQR